MTGLLSDRIARLRKERGLTQEQLGQLVGVSAQAVSKWEKGGAPDVELLPALADRLGVTIDGLFGRESGPAKNMHRELTQWLCDMPVEQRFRQLYLLLESTAQNVSTLGSQVELARAGVPQALTSCYLSDGSWMRFYIKTDEGLLLGVPSEDLPLYLLLPEPPAGYEAHFGNNEDYRRLFSALSLEGSLEVLRYLYGQKDSYYTASAVSARTGLEKETAERVMAALERCHLLYGTTLELENGSVPVYAAHNNQAFVPFLLFARWLMEKDDAWTIGWTTRTRPILTPPPRKEGKAYET